MNHNEEVIFIAEQISHVLNSHPVKSGLEAMVNLMNGAFIDNGFTREEVILMAGEAFDFYMQEITNG